MSARRAWWQPRDWEKTAPFERRLRAVGAVLALVCAALLVVAFVSEADLDDMLVFWWVLAAAFAAQFAGAVASRGRVARGAFWTQVIGMGLLTMFFVATALRHSGLV